MKLKEIFIFSIYVHDPWTSHDVPNVSGYLSPWSVVLLIPLLKLPGYFAGILEPPVLPNVFLLPFSMVCRPPSPPSRTAWLFCWDPWTSRVVPRVSPRISPRVSLIFLRGLSSSFSLFANCRAILPGSLNLACFPTCFSYLSPWSVVLLLPLLKLPGYFAGILRSHVFATRVFLTFLLGLSSSLSPFSNCLAILPGSLDLTCIFFARKSSPFFSFSSSLRNFS